MLYGFWRLQVRGRHPTGEALEREDIRMRHERCLAAFLGVLLWGATGRADITMTTPYDYDHPPKPGTERGTYMAAATGSFGPDCFFTFIGTAKYLPNPDGSGGKHCTKGNVELSGSGPGCAFKPYETMPVPLPLSSTLPFVQCLPPEPSGFGRYLAVPMKVKKQSGPNDPVAAAM